MPFFFTCCYNRLSVVVLHYCRTTVLPYYTIVVLQCCRTTVLPYYSGAALSRGLHMGVGSLNTNRLLNNGVPYNWVVGP